MTYAVAFEKHDYGRIDKLNTLRDPETFWADVRKFTKNVKSDHAINRWECLAWQRWEEVKLLKKPVDKYQLRDF